MRTAVLVGSTGLVGSALIKKLVSDADFNQVIAIVRSRKGLSEALYNSPKLRLLEFDFNNWNELELQISSFLGASRPSFFCCLGTTIAKAGSQEAFKKVDHDCRQFREAR